MEEEVLSEINMTQETLQNGVKHLIEWIKHESHLPNITDEQLLKSFIIGSKSVERAKERLDKYFTARTKYPAIFGDRDPDTIDWHRALRTNTLDELTPEHYNVNVCTNVRDDEAKYFKLAETLKVWFMVLDEELRRRPFTSGQIVIVDCSNFSLKQIFQIYPSLVAATLKSYQNALPIRIKLLIYFNAPSVFAMFFTHAMKPFFSAKVKQRIHIHSQDHTILEQYVPKHILPSDYGGSNLSMDELYVKTQQALKKEKAWFTTEGIIGSDETKRKKH